VAPPSTAQSVGRFVEDQVQQGNVELNDSISQSQIVGWLSKAFLVAIVAMVVLLGFVMYLFIRWRNTEPRTVAVSAAAISKKDLEGEEEKAPLDTTVGKTGEMVMPGPEKMPQLPDQTGPGAANPMRQNPACGTEIESNNEEVLRVLIELSAVDSSVVEKVAQLAKLYAMGTPSENEFQRLKEQISHSQKDSLPLGAGTSSLSRIGKRGAAPALRFCRETRCGL
jgi:hypothetical protein